MLQGSLVALGGAQEMARVLGSFGVHSESPKVGLLVAGGDVKEGL